MGYHDLSPEAFLTVEVVQTNSAEEACLFRDWIDRMNAKARGEDLEDSDECQRSDR